MLVPHRLFHQDRDARSLGHQIQNVVDVVTGEQHPGLKPGLGADLLHHPKQPGFLVQLQKGFLPQFRRVDLLPAAQRMARRQHHRKPVFHHRQPVKPVRIGPVQPHIGHVAPATFQFLQQIDAFAFHHLQLDKRVFPVKSRDHVGYSVHPHHRNGVQPQRRLLPVVGSHGPAQLFLRRHYGLGPGQQRLACRRQVGPACCALKQLHPQFLFQRQDLLGHVALGGEHQFRRFGITAGSRHLQKIFQPFALRTARLLFAFHFGIVYHES